MRRAARAPLFPYTTLFRSERRGSEALRDLALHTLACWQHSILDFLSCMGIDDIQKTSGNTMAITMTADWIRSEEHTSELQSRRDLVCRLLLEKKKHDHVAR